MRRPSLFKCSWQRECGSVDSIFFVFYDKLPHIIAIYSVFTNKQLSYPSSAKYMLIAFVHSRHLYYAFIWPNNDLNKSSSNESLFTTSRHRLPRFVLFIFGGIGCVFNFIFLL
eukprot:714074_1